MAMTLAQKTDMYRFFAIAFNAAPGIVYMDQLDAALAGGMTTKQVVNAFTTKAVFTAVYPNFLDTASFATNLVNNVVGASATADAKAQAVADIVGALNIAGTTRGDVIYTVFNNLANKAFTDATWGGTAKQLANQVTVAQYYTENVLGNATDTATLQSVIAHVTNGTDVSTTAAIQAVLGTIGATPFTLTTGIDQGALWVGGLNNDVYYGKLDDLGTTATLNTFDSIDGAGGVNTLSLTDTVANDDAVLPDATLANIQKVIVQTVGNAGVFAVTAFDITGHSSVTDLTVSSAGTDGDFIAADVTQNVTVTATGGAVTVDGGLVDTVTAAGAVSIVGATGAVDATTTGGTVGVTGGTTVTVHSSNAGTVTVGSATVAASNASGAISVTATKGAAVNAYGGTNVAVSTGGAVTVGATAAKPAGTVTVTQASYKGAVTGDVATVGGTSVTINTAGGGAAAAVAVSKVTGAVSVTDTNTTLSTNADAFAIAGGTTVGVTTTATSAVIAVGAAAGLNAAGTGLDAATLAADPSGNVTIVNGSAWKYGTGASNVYTNGATSVTIDGGGAATVVDAQTTLATAGANIGLAIGTNTLASVSLSNIASGASAITSNALRTLTLSGDAVAVTANVVGAHALAINSSANLSGASVTDATATSVAITTTGTAADVLALSAALATSLTVTGTDALALTATSLPKVTGVTLSGSGAVTADVSGMVLLTAVTATDSSANNVITIDATKATFTGGSGNDTLIIAAAPTKAINGGAGAGDVLTVNYAAGGFDAAASAYISGFEVLGLGSAATAGTYTATGFTGLTLGAVAGAIAFSNAAAGTTLAITAAPGATVGYTLATGTGTADAVTVTVGTATSTGFSANTVTTSAIETVTINSVGKSGTNTITLVDTVTATGVLTLNIGGTAAFTLSGNSGTGVKTINVTDTKAVNVSAATQLAAGATINGGAGVLTATGGAGVGATVINTGAGGGVITVGTGGLVGGTTVLSFAAGSETINLAASAAVADTVIQINKGDAAVSGFVINGTAADTLQLAALSTVLANATVTAAGPTGLNYAVSNGVITFSGSGPVLLSSFADSELLQVAANLVKAASTTTVNQANAIFAAQNGTDSYVVTADVAVDGAITLTKLAGVTGLQGFGTTAASNTVLATSFTNTLAGAAALPAVTGSNAAVLVNDGTGYSLVNEASLSGGVVGATSTKITGLAAAAEVDLGTTTATSLITTQVGAAGTNSLTVAASASKTLAALNVTGDWSLALSETTGNTLTVTSLVDGATTDTLTTINVSGAGAVVLAAITDTALTTIKDTGTGAFTLGSGTVLSNAGVTITGGTGANTISVSGINDVIKSASVAASTYTASGDNTTITLSGTGNLAGTQTIAAIGAGDTIDVSALGTGTGNFAVNVGSGAASVGSNAIVKLGVGVVAGLETVYAGVNTTVSIGGAYDVVNVANAAAGWGTTSNMTTVQLGSHGGTAVTAFTTGDTIQFATAAAIASVNVSSATSVATALAIADVFAEGVGAGALVWFQYGGDTYVLQNTVATSTTAIDATDIVVKVVGIHDMSAAVSGGVVTIGA